MTGFIRRWAIGAVETLDDVSADPEIVAASLRDIARINRAFGGTAAVARRLGGFLEGVSPGSTLTLLDVGTGSGDIPRSLARIARRREVRLDVVGLERHPACAREAARAGELLAVIGDGASLPFRDRSIDLVLCAKVLHHTTREVGRRLVSEMDRVARRGVVVADLKRSWLAAFAIWLASFPMRFHPATRRDSVISVFRGFTRRELERECAAAGVTAQVRSHPGYVLTAAWPARGTA